MSFKAMSLLAVLIAGATGAAQACVIMPGDRERAYEVELRVLTRPRVDGLSCRVRAAVLDVIATAPGVAPLQPTIEVVVGCYTSRVSPPCPVMPADEIRPGRRYRALLNPTDVAGRLLVSGALQAR